MKKKTSLSKKVGEIATKKNVKKTIKKANDASNFIIENKNTFFIVGGLILGFFVVRQVKKGISSVGEVFKSDEVDFIKPEINPSIKNLTITSNQAVILAKSLLDAFNHTTFIGSRATDEVKVKETFEQIKTGDDFKLVYNAFGERKRFGGGTPTFYLDKKVADAYDLIYWLKEELDSYWDKEVYDLVKERVTSAGLIF